MRQNAFFVFVVLALAPVAPAQTVVNDSTFNDNDWSLTVYGSGSVSANQSTVGSNPIRSVTNTVNATPSLILGTHIYTPFTYDPAVSGAVSSVCYTESAICLSNCVGSGQRTGPALVQGGIAYVYNNFAAITGTSTSFHTLYWNGLTSADFARVIAVPPNYWDNSQHPDFSASGAPIQFGFFRANGNTQFGGQAYTIGAGIDDWQITINGAATTPTVVDCQLLPTATQTCSSVVSFTGAPSATSTFPSFMVTFGGLNAQANGIVFYGLSGPASAVWSPESLLCVKAVTQRLNGLPGAFSNTGGSVGSCDGEFSFDMNQVIQGIALNPITGLPYLGAPMTVCTTVDMQAWQRDPASIKTTNHSDALRFTVGP